MNILIIGLGGLGKAFLYLYHLINLPIIIEKFIIVEQRDLIYGKDIPKNIKNYQHIQQTLTKENYIDIFDSILSTTKISLVLDMSVATGSIDFIRYFTNKCHYINSSLEDWKGKNRWDGQSNTMIKNSLQYHAKQIENNNCKTIMHSMGMNPGITEIFTKISIDRLIEMYNIKAETYGEAAFKLGIEVIHISERDTQVSKRKYKNKAVNTWSPIGMQEEMVDNVQISINPNDDNYTSTIKYGRQLLINTRSINLKAKSFEPIDGKFNGYLIPHYENYSIGELLRYGRWNPSVYYVYKMCPDAVNMAKKLKKNNYQINYDYKILDSIDIKEGYDSVGVLFLFKDKKQAYSMHTIINNESANVISDNINATMIQTACGLFIAIQHIIDHPNNGVNTAVDVDHNKAFRLVENWLGYIHEGHVNFKPKINCLLI